MSTRPIRALIVALLLLTAGGAFADKIDVLTRTLMQDPSYKVRVQAALVLGKLKDKRAVPALMQALHDENETVRGVAATSLGRIGDPSASNALMVASTTDASEFVRSQAKRALELVAGGGGGSWWPRRRGRERASTSPSASPRRARPVANTRGWCATRWPRSCRRCHR